MSSLQTACGSVRGCYSELSSVQKHLQGESLGVKGESYLGDWDHGPYEANHRTG